jgi:23S rRNA pseudouridine1911/1915/1917 synthase
MTAAPEEIAQQIEYTYEGAPERLDRIVLAALEPHIAFVTRSQVQQLIANRQVTVNGAIEDRGGAKIKSGSALMIRFERAKTRELVPYDLPLEILYEDEHLIVINKPAGLTMHPGAGNIEFTLVNALLHHCGAEFQHQFTDKRPGIVHRLDKDTTGVVVCAKDARMLELLAKQFRKHTVKRAYRALVYTTPRARRLIDSTDKGTIETFLWRDPVNRFVVQVTKDQGKHAITHWQVVERFHYGTLVELQLETGRTHQIRVHMAHLGSPLLGDQTYGDSSVLVKPLQIAAEKLGRQALHAFRLEFTHPALNKRMLFETPLPADMAELYTFLKNFKG